MPRLIFKDLHKLETSSREEDPSGRSRQGRRLIYENIGLPHDKVQQCGVYIFSHIGTNKKYVGSSSQLALRLKGYLNQTRILRVHTKV